MRKNLYPEIKIDRIKKPSRLYAFPVVGYFIKLIIIIPVGIELFFLNIVRFIFSILNSFSIFSSGKYWKTAYTLNLGVMKLETNLAYFLWGLTDTYPGFALDTTNYDLNLALIKNPNRFLATPVLGIIIRFILMIPYMIYRSVISTAALLAILVSWIFVLLYGRYPETTFEIARDSVRIDQAASAYFLGISDIYPSFWISMNHKVLKILLIVIATLISLWSFMGNGNPHLPQRKQMQNNRYFNTVQNPTGTYTY